MTRCTAIGMRLQGQGLVRPFASVEDCVKACIGIQTQYSQSLPISIAARTSAKPPPWFSNALDVGGPLRKTWTVRWTLHTVHEDDIALLVSALGRHFHNRFVRQSVKHLGISESALREREEQVWKVLCDKPLNRKELHDRVAELKGLPGAGWGWDVAGLAYEGRLYVSSHHGATTFVAVEPPNLMEEVAAQGELLKRYLKAYGPASRLDMQRWSGLYLSTIDRALEAIERDLHWIELEGLSDRFAILKEQQEMETDSRSVKLLAKFDGYVMAHKNKALYLPDRHASKVFRPAGQVEATILKNGVIHGTWRAERKGKKLILRIEPFESFGQQDRRRIEKEAEGVGIALGAESVECTFA